MSDVKQLSATKRQLLGKLLRESGPHLLVDSPIRKIPQGERPPLSFAQEKFWLLAQSPEVPPLHNECIIVHRNGPLDVAVLERCFIEVITRHEIWRTSYESHEGQLFQNVHPAPSHFLLQVTDLRGLPENDRELELLSIACDATQLRLDLRTGPLLRASVVRLGDEKYKIIIVAHLSIVDGVSAYQILPAELKALYDAFSQAKRTPLSPLEFQYSDFAYSQRNSMHSERFESQLRFWKQQLSEPLQVTQLPNDYPRRAIRTFRGAMHSFTMDRQTSEAVKALATTEGVTLFTCLQAAFAALIRKYTGLTEIVIGTFSSPGRAHSEFAGALGHFLNPVTLRIDVGGDPTISELLRRIQKVTSDAISNDEIPLDLLARELKRTSDPSRDWFFDTAISLQPAPQEQDDEWYVTSMDANSGGAIWDLYLAFIDRPEGIAGRVQYNPDLFRASTIIETMAALTELIAAASTNPSQSLSALVKKKAKVTSTASPEGEG